MAVVISGADRHFLAKHHDGLADYLRHIEHVVRYKVDVSHRGNIPPDIHTHLFTGATMANSMAASPWLPIPISP